MRIGISGDFDKLKKLVKKTRELGGPQALTELNVVLAEATIDLIADGFAEQHDPYGNPWRPKRFPDGRAILVGTSRLRRGWHRKTLSATSFSIAPAVAYAAYHQFGTGIYGPRRRRVTPKKKGGVLAFRAGGSTMFARSVAGIPPRRMIPERGQLPHLWRTSLNAAANDYLRERFSAA